MNQYGKYVKIFIFAAFAVHSSCGQNTDNEDSRLNKKDPKSTKRITVEDEEVNSVENKNLPTFDRPKGLVDIQTINPNIRVELKYATSDNFMKMKLYDTLTNAYLQKEVAVRLGKCQDFLNTIDNNLYLLIYDAIRPISVQQKMWNALDSIPVSERVKFVSNPINRSIHNYGAAVDVTICNENGIPLDMGAEYDDLRKIAYPSMEAHFLKTGELTDNQLQNRMLLRRVMASQGFRNIPTEWWHFNAFSRQVVKEKFQPLY